jgi:hypothetical protein
MRWPGTTPAISRFCSGETAVTTLARPNLPVTFGHFDHKDDRGAGFASALVTLQH